jgi:hypothetical protein
MWRALFVLAFAGCEFTHGLLDPVSIDAAPDDSSTDAVPDARADAMIDARIAPFCDMQDTNLVACYQFENTTNDASGHNLDLTMTNVTFVNGKVGKAMQFAANSAADAADSAMWDVSAVTIEAWINPSQLPAAGARSGILDMNGQYGFFLHETGKLACTIVGGISSGQVTANVAINTWSHVACTYDGTTTTVYKDGNVVFTGTGGGALSTTSTTGISIAADNPPGSGSRLIGLVDEVRIMSRARTANEICQDAACTP